MISISILVPVYNEENSLLDILKKIKKVRNNIDTEIIIINDGSTDNTKKIIEDNKNYYDVVKHFKKNMGKGKAIIEALKMSTKDYVFFQDADLEYDPIDLNNFVETVDAFSADFIMGSRFISDKSSVLHFWHMLGNKFITFVFNILNNTTFTDIYCCHCLFKRKNLPILKLKSFGWGQQAEILTYLTSNSIKIYDIGINYNARKYSEGKKIKYYHIFEIIYWIIITRIRVFFNTY